MLTVYSLGFVVHPYRVAQDGSWSSPFLAVPRVPHHRAFVVVDGTILPIHPDGLHTVRLVGRDSGGATLPLADARIRRQNLVNGIPASPSQPASWENFDLVPDVSTFTVLPVLTPGWRSALLFELDLVGGELTALPDHSTLLRTWTWPDNHKQAVTALTRYTVPNFATGELVIDGNVVAQVGPNSTLHLLNVVPSTTSSDSARYAQGLDHHVAILALGQPSSQIAIQNPLVSTALPSHGVSNSEYATRVEPVLKMAKSSPGSAGTGAVTIEPGYPSCSGRRMRLP
jgi:hypothetical protein